MAGQSIMNRPPLAATTAFGNTTGFGVQPTIPPIMQQAPFQSLNRNLNTTPGNLPLPPPLLPGQQTTGLPMNLNNPNDLMFNRNNLPPLPPHPMPAQDNLMSSRMNNTSNLNGNKRGNNLGKSKSDLLSL